MASLSPYRPEPRWQRIVRWSAGALSVLVHLVFAALLMANSAAPRKAAAWVEVAIHNVPPPPPPPPPPVEPEPPAPPDPPKKAPPKTVQIEDLAPPPPDTPPPQDATPQPRTIRKLGLSTNSFATGGTTGFSAKQGNTTAVADSQGALPAGADAWVSRPYAAVAQTPKLKFQPPTMDVPEEARKANVVGTVEVILDLDPNGKVTRVRVVKDLGYGTGEACAAAWRKSTWKPGEQDGAAVAVEGIRKVCTVMSE